LWPIGVSPAQTRRTTSDAGARSANTRGLGLKHIHCESFGQPNRMPLTFAPRTSRVCDQNFHSHSEFVDSHLGFHNHGDRNSRLPGQAQSGRNVEPRGPLLLPTITSALSPLEWLWEWDLFRPVIHGGRGRRRHGRGDLSRAGRHCASWAKSTKADQRKALCQHDGPRKLLKIERFKRSSNRVRFIK
jgi:hypothetical protein